MKAMVIKAPRGVLEVEERSRPTPKPGEVLIGVRACGVCHGDLMVQEGAFPFARYPIVPGTALYEQTSFITHTNALQTVATIQVHATQRTYETHVQATQTMFEIQVQAMQTILEIQVHAMQTMFEIHTQALQNQEQGAQVQHWL